MATSSSNIRRAILLGTKETPETTWTEYLNNNLCLIFNGLKVCVISEKTSDEVLDNTKIKEVINTEIAVEAYLSYLVVDEPSLEEKLVNEVKDIRPQLVLVRQSFQRFGDICKILLILEHHMPFNHEERRISDKLTEDTEKIVIIQGPNWNGKTKLAVEVVLKKVRHLQKTEKNLKVIIVSELKNDVLDDLLPLRNEGIAVEFVPTIQRCLPELVGKNTERKRILLMNEKFSAYGENYDWCTLKDFANTDWVLNLKDDTNVEDCNEDGWIKKDWFVRIKVRPLGNGRKRNPSSPLAIKVELCKPKAFRLDTNCYPMTKQVRGFCLIIDVDKFDSHEPRVGSAMDSRNLQTLFTDFNFNVILEKNPTSEKIGSIMEQLQLMHKDIDVDMCTVFVLSHGHRGEVINPDKTMDHGSYFFTSDDKMVATEYIIRHVREISKLLGKPKFFTFQCCQGSDIEYLQSEEVQADRNCSGNLTTISTQSEDTVIVYAALPGKVAWRNTTSGSWLINHLCEVLMKNAKEKDLLYMLLEMQTQFKERKEPVDGVVKTQCPQVSNRGFTKLLYFNPGLYRNDDGQVVKVDPSENNNQITPPPTLQVFNMDEINSAAGKASSNVPAT